MPDTRKHRGQHPADRKLFSEKQLPQLRQAVADFSWLLGRGYPEKAALKLVGDRFRLKARQRKAVLRCTCPQDQIEPRKATEIPASNLAGRKLHIDGFNLLITIESALSDGFIFESQDGCYRDLASIHGTYKRVMETEKAVRLVGEVLRGLKVDTVLWLFDKPVSNSGRLKVLLYQVAAENNWDWELKLFHNPDNQLIRTNEIVVSCDSQILDQSKAWCNLARFIIDNYIRDANIVRLG